MRIYVAGASAEVEDVGKMILRLKEAGYTITFDWTEGVKIQRARGWADEDLTSNDRRKAAQSALLGVDACDVFWLMVPEAAGIGAWVEFGYALQLASSREIVLVLSGRVPSIFVELAHFKCATHEVALDLLCDVMRERRDVVEAGR